MTATALSSAVYSEPRRACLFQNPYRLVSLLKIMKVVKCDALLMASRDLWIFSSLVGRGDRADRIAQVEGLKGGLRTCYVLCGHLGLDVSRLHIEDSIRFLSDRPNLTLDEAERMAATVTNSIEKELSLRIFLTVPPDKADYFNAFTPDYDPIDPDSVQSIWEPIFSSFGSIKYDATESFKCYALGRHTASVFHLMRVLKLGLAAIGKVFDVSLDHTNWAKALDQIESKIKKMHEDPHWKSLGNHKEEQEFYSQASSHLRIVKDAWRNYTAHARGKYDAQEASDILISVRAFMQKLSTRLNESGGRIQ